MITVDNLNQLGPRATNRSEVPAPTEAQIATLRRNTNQAHNDLFGRYMQRPYGMPPLETKLAAACGDAYVAYNAYIAALCVAQDAAAADAFAEQEARVGEHVTLQALIKAIVPAEWQQTCSVATAETLATVYWLQKGAWDRGIAVSEVVAELADITRYQGHLHVAGANWGARDLEWAERANAENRQRAAMQAVLTGPSLEGLATLGALIRGHATEGNVRVLYFITAAGLALLGDALGVPPTAAPVIASPLLPESPVPLGAWKP